MLSGNHFQVFEKYKDAAQHAFSNNIVTEEDKDIYQEIFRALCDAADAAIARNGFQQRFDSWNVRFGRNGGVQGHRPVDLWASVINLQPDSFGRFPQTYIIASELGLEIGFTVAIHESDYFNLAVKQQNREIIPLLYNKLPDPDEAFVRDLDNELTRDGGWLFGVKSRQGAAGDFPSLSKLIEFLKSPKSSVQGGGSIYRIIDRAAVLDEAFDVEKAFSSAVVRFESLMRTLVPAPGEHTRVPDIQFLHKEAAELPDYHAEDMEDGRKKILRAVAVRQGQAKFREQLIEAYKGRCAITGTPVVSILQAAHIVPYNGPQTNSVQNGLLLRADIHNLFDLGLLQIDPETFKISVADELRSSSYVRLDGRRLKLPERGRHRPSRDALARRRELFA